VGSLGAERRDGDHARPVALDEVRDRVLRGEEGPGDVDVLDVLPVREFDVLDGRGRPCMPALFTSRSRPPNSSTVRPMAARTFASSVTSVSRGSVRTSSRTWV
jgi:hypothetical protein